MDIMSLVHFLSGMGVGLFFWFIFRKKSDFSYSCFVYTLLILLFWELFESFLRMRRVYPQIDKIFHFLPAGWFTQETMINIGGDMLTGLLGALLIYLIFRKYYFVSKNIK